jgi:hypothetical protein
VPSKNSKSPEQIQRSKLRLEIKKLVNERSQVISTIEEIEERLAFETEHKWTYKSMEDEISTIRGMSDKELDDKYLRYGWRRPSPITLINITDPIRAVCVWFGDGTRAVKGSTGYRDNLWRTVKGSCKNPRNPLDVYCYEHRDLANQVLSDDKKVSENAPPPIPYFKSEVIRKELITGMKNAYKADMRDEKSDLKESKSRLREIDQELTRLNQNLAGMESDERRQRLPENIRLSIYKKYNFECALCEVDLTLVKPHIDHIKPLAKGGKDVISNLQPLCEPCNLKKGSKYED